MAMVPAGYLYKRVVVRPDWLKAPPGVKDIYSISSCISKTFAAYINHWMHNGLWILDNPEIMQEIARKDGIDLTGMTLFYYEVFEEEFREKDGIWTPLTIKDFPMNVLIPEQKYLHGYDVCTFWTGNSPECSPLSCNSLCEVIPVNEHCLFDTFEQAEQALSNGLFDKSEPGPFRIFAVYTVGEDTPS
jgi:hypothetical protein